jgi:two-component SAPR family response regulator
MNIMVVDDKALAVNALCRILREVAPENSCSTAGSASDALELAKKTRFDVVFLDIEMPYMNGLELAKNSRRRTSPSTSSS